MFCSTFLKLAKVRFQCKHYTYSNEIQIAPTIVSSGLVAYYPFNGNANDGSGNKNDGTNNGATLINDRFGNNDNAYVFNAPNNVIESGLSHGFNGTGSRSISIWVNPLTKQGRQDIFSTGACSQAKAFEIIYDETWSDEGIIFGGYSNDYYGNNNTQLNR